MTTVEKSSTGMSIPPPPPSKSNLSTVAPGPPISRTLSSASNSSFSLDLPKARRTTSSQNAYEGIGWNDCLPSNFGGSQPSSRVPSRVPSRAGSKQYGLSRAVSGGSTISQEVAITDSDEEDASNSPSTDISQEEIPTSLESVQEMMNDILNRPSSLPSREFNHYKARLLSFLPNTETHHLVAIDKSLKLAVEGKSEEARQVIVDHSLVHSGISQWVIALRKVFEGLSIN